MGTIVIGLDHKFENLHETIRSLQSQNEFQLTLKEKYLQKLKANDDLLIKSGYRRHIHGYINGKFIHLSSDPFPSTNPFSVLRNLYAQRLTIHLSQFRNLRALAETLSKAFGNEIARDIFFHGSILRLDAWIDLQVPFSVLRQSSFRKYVRKHENVEHGLRSIYYGKKSPNGSVIYEKPSIPAQYIDKSIVSNSKEKCRIEIRHLYKKVPIKHLCQYGELAKIDLFQIQQVKVLRKKKLLEHLRSARLNPNTIGRIQKYLARLNSDGAHFARKALNDQRNFHKTIGPKIDSFSVDIDLSRIWKRKVQNRIVGNFDAKNFFNEAFHD